MIVLVRAEHTPVAEISYVPTLLITTVASMVAATIGHSAIEMARPSESRRPDVRDKEIGRSGDLVGRWFVIFGSAAAFIMASAGWDRFWIANVIYLGFVLWAVVGSTVKVVAYRHGLRPVS